MKTAFKILAIFAIGGIIGLGIYSNKIYKDIKNIDYKLVKYKIIDIYKNNIIIDFVLQIKNISVIKIKIVGYELDIFLNEIKVGTVKGNKAQVIKAEQYSLLSIPLEINLTKTFGIIKSAEILLYLQSAQDKIIIQIKGMFAAEALKLKVKNIPIDYSITLKEILEIMDKP